MRYRKLFTRFLSLTVIVLLLSCGVTFAKSEETSDIGSAEKVRYLSYTGTVVEIRDRGIQDNSKFISLKNENGQPTNVIVSDNTYVFEGADINVGSLITVYYDANKPMILIYPPQYNAEVVIVENGERNIKFDVFDNDLISSDNFLKLIPCKSTEILSQDGKPYVGSLENQKLITVYGAATKSIPAQTTPDKIIVLSGYEVDKMKILVNDQVIDSPAAYSNEQGAVMVPLRAIAEALGYDVHWNNATRSVTIGKGISLTIGKDYYVYMRMSPIYLGVSPELVDSTTYVPLSFFNKVMMVDEANITDGQIVVNNTDR
ncbi:MAG TPA: copper amine oxidase N-terminal domain-containing protein [Anaerovoracaceae bacterium]|nr:copper amine oxidase N-terminal domain-containing protein [Anaerovoracaceae bacterium]